MNVLIKNTYKRILGGALMKYPFLLATTILVSAFNAQALTTQTFSYTPTVTGQFGQTLLLSASVDSGLAIDESVSAGCDFVGRNNNPGQISLTIKPTSMAGCTVTLSQAGDATYDPASAVITVTVNKADQSINASVSASQIFVGQSFNANASATSGEPVSIDSVSANVTGSGTNAATFTGTAVGTATIRFNQTGNANYNAAPQVTQDVQVVVPNIVFNATGPFYVGSTNIGTVTGDVDPAGSFSVASGSCTISGTGSTASFSSNQVGDCTFNYETSYGYVTKTPVVSFVKRDQTISVTGTTAAKVTNVVTLTANTNSGLVITPTVTTPANCSINNASNSAGQVVLDLLMTAVSECKVEFSQAGDATYNPAVTQTATIAITKLDQNLTAGVPANVKVDDAFSVTVNSSNASLPISSVLVTSANCTITNTNNSAGQITLDLKALAVPSCQIKFDQAGDATYNAANSLTVTVPVAKVDQVISVSGAPSAAVVDDTFSVTATVDSGLALTAAANAACVISNMTNSPGQIAFDVEVVATPTCQLTFNQAGDAKYNAINQVVNVGVTKADQTITIVNGAPAHGTINMDYDVLASASSGLGVSITTSGNCIMVGGKLRPKTAGTCTVTYAQAGDSNYNPAPSLTETVIVDTVQSINIIQAPPVGGKYQDTVTTSAESSSGLPVHISVSDPYCSLDPEPAVGTDYAVNTTGVYLAAIGNCTITYTLPAGEIGGVWYEAGATVKRTVVVDRWTQVISIIQAPPSAQQANSVVQVSATVDPAPRLDLGEAPRPVVIGVVAGSSCSVQSQSDNEAEIFLSTQGATCSITFNQAGNSMYKPAPQVVKVVTISQVTTGKDIDKYWKAKLLFTTGESAATPQPIMSAPMLARNGEVKAAAPNVMVVFGTGIYHQKMDLTDKSINTVYGVHDRGEYDIARYKDNNGKKELAKRVFASTTLTNATTNETKQNRTVTGEGVDWVNQYGWYVDLATDSNGNNAIDSAEKLGERSVFRPFIANKLFVFNTVQPVVGTCTGATQGWTMLIDWSSGLAPDFATYDANMDGVIDSNDKGYLGYFNETAGSELGRGGDSIYDTSGDEARRTTVTFGSAEDGVRLGWEEKTPYGVLKR